MAKPSETADPWTELRQEWRAIWRFLAVTLGVLWVAELVDLLVFSGALDGFGVRPREVAGLIGVLAHPFLHGGLGHLVSNTVGFALLAPLVIARGRRHYVLVWLVGTLLGGLGVWLVGRGGSVHIGASGVVFALFGYLLSAGWFERRFGTIVLSVFVLLVYGGMIYGVLPGQVGVSWECHLFGFLSGVLMAKLLARPEPEAASLESLRARPKPGEAASKRPWWRFWGR